MCHPDTLPATSHLEYGRDMISVPCVAAFGVSYQSLQERAVLFVPETRIHSEQDVSPSLKRTKGKGVVMGWVAAAGNVNDK